MAKLILKTPIPEPQLLIDSGYGKYTPQVFAQRYNKEVNFSNYADIKECLDVLCLPQSPDRDDYYEVWENVLNHAKMVIDEVECYLYQPEDLWVVAVGYKSDEFFNI
jgi:hypothetical protein